MSLDDTEIDALISRAYARDETLTGKDVNTLLRACLTAAPGCLLIAPDLSAIEARVLAWAAGQHDTLEAFRVGDPYRDLAAYVYGVPVEAVTRKMRQLGKGGILGAGFSMSGEKFETAAAKQYGVDWSTCPLSPDQVIALYRERNHRIVTWWRTMQDAAVAACHGHTTDVGPVEAPPEAGRYTWGPSPLRPPTPTGDGDVWLMLPSGRPIVYYGMRAMPGRRGYELVFQGRRGPDRTYGGKLVENAVQATARDILADCMLRAEANGLVTVGHTHDEAIFQFPAPLKAEAEALVGDVFSTTPGWAAGLPLKSEWWCGYRYRK